MRTSTQEPVLGEGYNYYSLANSTCIIYIVVWCGIPELEITAGHWTFSDQIIEMTDQIPHATP